MSTERDVPADRNGRAGSATRQGPPVTDGGPVPPWLRHVARLVGYALVVAWLTWPLARVAGSALPNTHEACTFDTLFVAATLAHESEALTRDPTRIGDLGIYRPAEWTLFYGDAGAGALPLFFPVYVLTGNPALAVNFTFLGGVVFACFALHTVVWWWTRSEVAGFFAAWVFLMNAWTLWEFLPTAPIYAVLGFFPFIVYLSSTPAPSLRSALRMVPLVVLQSLASIVYLTGSVLGPLTVLGLYRTFRRATRGAGVRILVVVATSLLLLLPFGAGYLLVRAANPSLSKQTIWAVVMPTRLPWGVLGWNAPTAITFGGFALIVVGGVLFLRSRSADRTPELRQAWRTALFWAVVGTAVSLTPVVKLFDRWSLTLPHGYLLSYFPAYEVGFFREPRRLGVGGLMGLALLGGLAFAECARRMRAAWPSYARPAVALVAALLAAEMYWEYSVGSPSDPRWRRPKSDAYPTQPAPVPHPQVLAALGKSDGPVLELPLATAPFKQWPAPHARAMYRAIYHDRPLVNGYSGYWPEGFQERMDLARTLPNDASLAALVSATGLATVVVNVDELSEPELAAWTAEAARQDSPLRLIERHPSAWVFEVDGPRAGALPTDGSGVR